jgi:hypothetical protein
MLDWVNYRIAEQVLTRAHKKCSSNEGGLWRLGSQIPNLMEFLLELEKELDDVELI